MYLDPPRKDESGSDNGYARYGYSGLPCTQRSKLRYPSLTWIAISRNLARREKKTHTLRSRSVRLITSLVDL